MKKRLATIKAYVEVALFVPMFTVIWVVAHRFCKNLNTPMGLYEEIMLELEESLEVQEYKVMKRLIKDTLVLGVQVFTTLVLPFIIWFVFCQNTLG